MRSVFEETRAPEGKPVDLKKWPTRLKPLAKGKQRYQELLAMDVSRLSELQRVLYASGRHALLLIFQGMDASGKDGAIRHVMSGVNPQGCQVTSFKEPSAEELRHDFLWRTSKRLPERGQIGIFNRSYYEEVLIARVHPEVLQGQHLPPETMAGKGLWEGRYRSITDLESHLYRNGTRILKFFLHLSKDEQKRRFLLRLDDKAKNWKLSPADIKERGFWKQYRKAYEHCLAATSTRHAPWFVVPADGKEDARLIISGLIIQALEGIKMGYPVADASQRKALKAMRKEL